MDQVPAKGEGVAAAGAAQDGDPAGEDGAVIEAVTGGPAVAPHGDDSRPLRGVLRGAATTGKEPWRRL